MWRGRNLFFTFSTSFLLFIIIPVFALNIVAYRAIRITEENESQTCVNRLSNGRETMDNRIKNIRMVVSWLRLDANLLGLEPLGGNIANENYYDIWRALQSIQNMDLSVRGMDMMVYYRKSDLILSPSFMAGYMKDFYGSLNQFGSYSYDACLKTYTVGNQPVFFPENDYLWNGSPLRGILYGTKLDGAGNTLVFFLLRSQSLMDAFSPVIDDKASLYVFDAEGTPLFSSGDDPVSENLNPVRLEGSGLLGDEYFGSDTIAAYSYSDYDLLYVSVMPKKAALRQVQTLRFLTLYLNIAAVFLSLGYAVFLAARNSRRLMGAFRLLTETSGVPAYHGGNTLNYLNNSVLQLINTNAMLRQDADTRGSILKSVFLDKLLSGFYTGRTEMYSFAEQAGIVLEGNYFCVVIINLDALEEGGDARQDMEAIERFNTVKQRIFSALEEWLQQRLGLLYSQTLNRLGVFFFLRPGQQEYFREHITALLRSTVVPVCTAMQVKVRFTGSGLYQDIMSIREGYNQCRDYTPSAAHWENGDFKWIDILPVPRQNMFVYPADMEKKLINQLQNADLPGVEASLSAVFNANIRDGLLNETMLTMLYTLLQGTFYKSLEGSLVDLFRDRVQNMDFTPGKVEADFLAIAKGICEAFAKECSEKIPSVKKEELISWVQEHFSEDNLTLTSAAKHFGFSETYFSQLFKETTGENFSTFLEITRLTNSQMLLRQYLKVEEVASRCGYKSTNTFRRAYKRHFGISPSRTR